MGGCGRKNITFVVICLNGWKLHESGSDVILVHYCISPPSTVDVVLVK